MIVAMIGMLTLVTLALGAVLPISLGALRDGRRTASRLGVESAARLGLEQALSGGWTILAAAVPAGGRISLPTVVVTQRIRVSREARSLGANLWVVLARAESRSIGGQLLGASERGILGRLVQIPADTIPRLLPASRSWLWRPP